MTEPTRPRPSGRKPAAKAKAKAVKPKPRAPKAAAPERPPAQFVTLAQAAPAFTRAAPAFPAPPAPYVPARSNGFAVASLVCAIGGVTFVPLIGGLAAVILGAIAIKKEREDPSRYAAGGMAIAGIAIGGFSTVVPLLIVTAFASRHITPIPFVLVAGFGAFAFVTATRGRTTTGQKAAILGGSLVATLVAIGVTIALGFGFYFLMRTISIEVGRSIGDAFGQMFDGIGKAFGSCGKL